MQRRTFLARSGASLMAAALTGTGARRAAAQATRGAAPIGPDHPLQAAWSAWRSTYLDSSGRVIDGPQDQASHSEGQGYGMTLAASFGDAAAFRAIHDWTESHLAGQRSDALLAWRWLPNAAPHVPDRNNATDGDLFYAWALMRGATLFGQSDYADRARKIAQDLAELCLARWPGNPGHLLMRPAVGGFDLPEGSPEGVIVNPSYYMPRAMRELARFAGDDRLARAADDGVDWMNRVSDSQLVPDWALVTDNGIAPAPKLSPDCGYEAMRVPLFLLWSGLSGAPALKPFARAYREETPAPLGATPVAATVLDPLSGAVKETSDQPGFRAIPALLDCSQQKGIGAAIPAFSTAQPYYPATLQLMTLVAQVEGYPACVPI